MGTMGHGRDSSSCHFRIPKTCNLTNGNVGIENWDQIADTVRRNKMYFLTMYRRHDVSVSMLYMVSETDIVSIKKLERKITVDNN